MARNGWAIGAGEEYQDIEYQDNVESQALYDILEKNIIPLYYDRGEDGLPHAWIRVIKESIQTVCPQFNTNRMLEEYMEQFYLPAYMQERLMTENQYQGAREWADWRHHVQSAWPGAAVQGCEVRLEGGMKIGDSLPVRVTVGLGSMGADELSLEAYHGRLDEGGPGDSRHCVAARIPGAWPLRAWPFSRARSSAKPPGQRGLMIRMMPKRHGLPHKFYVGLIKWWEG